MNEIISTRLLQIVLTIGAKLRLVNKIRKSNKLKNCVGTMITKTLKHPLNSESKR